MGSSPRMRGKRESVANLGAAAGLIPAHAGKTPLPTLTSRRTAAHPRACGENSTMPGRVLEEAGSSPRMRGKLLNT